MRLFGEAIEQWRPILDAVVGYPQQADVRGRSNEALLQILAKAVVDGERDDERSHARGYSDDRDAGDDADESLAAFGAQVAGRDEEFEAHEEASRQLLAVTISQDRIICISSVSLSWAKLRALWIDTGGILLRSCSLIPHPPGDHYCAGCDCESCQRPADCEARAQAPGQHFAEMAQIDWMTYAGADARRYQVLLAVARQHFGQSAQLGEGELSVSKLVKQQPCAK